MSKVSVTGVYYEVSIIGIYYEGSIKGVYYEVSIIGVCTDSASLCQQCRHVLWTFTHVLSVLPSRIGQKYPNETTSCLLLELDCHINASNESLSASSRSAHCDWNRHSCTSVNTIFHKFHRLAWFRYKSEADLYLHSRWWTGSLKHLGLVS